MILTSLVNNDIQQLKFTKNVFTERVTTLEWTPRGDGGVTIRGSVQEKTGCGTACHGLADQVVIGQWLDLLTLDVFSNLNDSV